MRGVGGHLALKERGPQPSPSDKTNTFSLLTGGAAWSGGRGAYGVRAVEWRATFSARASARASARTLARDPWGCSPSGKHPAPCGPKGCFGEGESGWRRSRL